MNQRISLTRIIAVNWYGFRQIIDLDDNVLISGAFGTGKSALLDLAQYVLLGEHWRANRAAAGNARGRDLVGYCLGDTNQTRGGQRHFLRSSGATLVALEFTWPKERGREAKRETWGVRLEYSSADAAPKQTWFFIPERLEYAAIAPEGRLLPDDSFRTWIRREYGNDCLFSRQRDYLEEMATARHLNFDSEAFQRTFPKAIAFEPEENVEKFIRDFILEENPLDVREVRNSLRAYDETRRRLERQEHEAGFLRRICEQHAALEKARRDAATLGHATVLLKLTQAAERRERITADLKRLEAEHAGELKEFEQELARSRELEKLLNEVRFEIQKDPAQVQFDRLDRDKRELEQNVKVLREARESATRQLDDRLFRWGNWLRHGSALALDGLKDVLQVDDQLLRNLRAGSDAERIAALAPLAARFNEIWEGVRDLLQPVENEKRALEHKLRQIAEDLENLNKGQAPGSFPLFHQLRERFGDRVEQLGRLIEVRADAERWWPALENYLGRNRWAIVAGEGDYREALEILRKTPPGREPESLLNPAEARLLKAGSVANSLFEKVEVSHPAARQYVQFLLGEVQCVETIEELEKTQASRAITPEGVFKQMPLRRRLRPAGTVELTLGREGLARMRKAKLDEQEEARLQFNALKQRLEDARAWLDTGRKGGLGDTALPDRAADLPRLPELEKELGSLRGAIDLLKTPELQARQERLNQLEGEERAVRERVGRLRSANETFSIKIKPLQESLAGAEEDEGAARLEAESSRVQLSREFTGILDAELLALASNLRAEFAKWNDCLLAAERRASEARTASVQAREKRNRERVLLATDRDEQGNLRHPEYQHDFPAEEESNDPWSARLRILDTVELEKSRQLAADRKKEWERRLEENVLNELNRRLGEAQNVIRLLDRYLSQPIGRFRYRISQKQNRDPDYAPIWQLLRTGFEPGDELAMAIQDSEVQRAKEDLMRAVDAPDDGGERARRLLDYRNYHRYDIEMVPADRPEAPPISLGRSGRNLSGGENQAPFFISMLAAFRRVYDRGDRASARSQQLGLVVMDEAFSKLSGDGIEDCLALAWMFQLQLVMAFPPERLGVMVPHAQTVVMCQKKVTYDKDHYVTRIDNIPHLTTMAEAMEALT